MKILTINAGSSSLKVGLFDFTPGRPPLDVRANARGIGQPTPSLSVQDSAGATRHTKTPLTIDHREALRLVLAALPELLLRDVEVIGHRVVHGGCDFVRPTRITRDVIQKLRELIPLAPLHQPLNVDLIEAALERWPTLPQIACFDTAIHHTLPEVAARFPLPRWVWDEGIRRYGFHGLSYEYVLSADESFRQGKTIIAHLGQGASITAFQDGESVETTMGFSPAGGIPMGTRSGDLDPGVIVQLLRTRSLTADELERLINRESGLKGLSESTSDMQTLLADSGNPLALLAIESFCYHAARAIAGLAAALSGVDRLIFTGGIGEHAAPVRSRICERLEFLDIKLEASANTAGQRTISNAAGKIAVHVIPTDEEQTIARYCRDWLATANTV